VTWAYQKKQEAEEERLGPQVAGQKENVEVLVELPEREDVLLKC
jgi:hypothetical protein